MLKIKKFFYFVVTIILILSLLSFTHLSSDNVKPSQKWNAEEIKEQAILTGCVYEYDTDLDMFAYKSLVSSSYLVLPHDGSNYNTVVVKLKNDIYAESEIDEDAETEESKENDATAKKEEKERFATPRLYYNFDEDGRFLSNDFCTATEISNSNTLVFSSYQVEEKNTLALNIDTVYAIEEITVYDIAASSIKTQISLPAIIVFFAVLLILLIIEPKFGYYKAIKQKIADEVNYTRELARGKRSKLLLHLGAMIFTLVLIAFIMLMITINCYTSASLLLSFVFCVLAVGLTLADRISSGKGCGQVKLFLVVAVLVGIMMCYTAPPASATTWDDGTHFRHSYNMANLYQGEESFSLYKLYGLYGWGKYTPDPTHFTRIMVAESAVELDFPSDTVNAYTAISYLPMASVISVISLLGADLIKILVLCRFATLAVFAYVCYMGIRKLKGGVLVFSSILLLPGVLFFGCSISYDSWMVAWFVYAFATVFSVFQDPERKFTTAELVKILIALFVACAPKSPYCVMLLPLLFISKNKFQSPKSSKNFKICTVLVLLLILAIMIIPGIFVYDLYSDPGGGSNVSSMGQIMYILSHPIRFIKLLSTHLLDYLSFSIFADHGIAYGYLNGTNEGYTHIFTVAMLIIGFCMFNDRKTEDISRQSKWFQPFLYLASFATVVLIATIMYLAFNDVGSNVINGCQYRYTFPLLAPILFCMRPRRIYSEIPEKTVLSLVYGGLAFNLLFGYAYVYLHLFLF